MSSRYTAPDLAARRLAARLVEKKNLVPPVDIRGMLQEYAEVIDTSWPYSSVDALVSGIGSGSRPRVFLRREAHRRRQLFTMAHELGHILIPWHVGSDACHPAYDVVGLPSYGQEEQADIFAGGVMLPDRWVGHLLRTHGQDMDSLLNESQTAGLSAIATVLGLRRNLFAGWVFIVHGPEHDRLVCTPGTNVLDYATNRTDLRGDALDFGVVELNGRRVSWYRLYEVADMPKLDGDQRTNTEVLRTVLQDVAGDPKTAQKLEQRINGKIGGILRASAGRSPHEMFTALEYRFAQDGYEHLLAYPDFRAWLARKARDVNSGNTRRRRLESK
jgi:hypothetical protein